MTSRTDAPARPRSTQRVRLPDGRTLGYADWGDPNGTPVIYFHGGLSARVDIAWAAPLCAERGVRLIAPDRPGIGISQVQPGRTLLDWPRDVAALADALGIERFAVLGWSLGAMYALACAYILPERITRTATVGGPAPLDTAAAGKQVGFITDTILGALSNNAPPLAGALLMAMKLLPPAIVKWSQVQQSSAPDRAVVSRLTPHQATAFFYEALRHGPAGEIQEYRIMYAPWGYQPEQIAGEVQLWHGAEDALCLPINAQQLAARIPHATLTLVPNAGHYLLHTHVAEILDALSAR